MKQLCRRWLANRFYLIPVLVIVAVFGVAMLPGSLGSVRGQTGPAPASTATGGASGSATGGASGSAPAAAAPNSRTALPNTGTGAAQRNGSAIEIPLLVGSAVLLVSGVYLVARRSRQS